MRRLVNQIAMEQFPQSLPKQQFDNALTEVKQILQSRLDAVIDNGHSAIFVDYPVYGNVGDLLIYLGSEQWISDKGFDVIGRWSMDNFPFRPLPPDVIIICQGGGNWGDIYRHQRFREKLIRRYQSNKIVVLPQSIHYEAASSIGTTQTALANHEDLHLFLRDQESARFCEEHFPRANTYTAPDMATWLYPLDKTLDIPFKTPRSERTLYLLRKDREARSEEYDFNPRPDDSVRDWSDLLPFEVTAARIARAIPFFARGQFLGNSLSKGWRLFAGTVARNAAVQLQQYGFVVTSRLHGHILATLLDIPNIVVDNSYGKLSRYHSAWHTELQISAMFQPSSKHT
jgi:pyruvyl transferase EpsO